MDTYRFPPIGVALGILLPMVKFRLVPKVLPTAQVPPEAPVIVPDMVNTALLAQAAVVLLKLLTVMTIRGLAVMLTVTVSATFRHEPLVVIILVLNTSLTVPARVSEGEGV